MKKNVVIGIGICAFAVYSFGIGMYCRKAKKNKQKEEIRAFLHEGYKPSEIAKEMNVSVKEIVAIFNN